MKLPSSKIYWADYLSYSALLTDKEICQVMKIIATRAMSYNNLSDNLSDNPSVYKLKQIQKLNNIQIDFYNCLEKAQDESARDYISKITNGRKGGRPKASKCHQVITNDSKSNNSSCLINVDEPNIGANLGANITPITHTKENNNNKMVLVERGKFYIDDTMEDYKDILQGMPDDDVEKCWVWIMDRFEYRTVSVEFVRKMLNKFKQGVEQ